MKNKRKISLRMRVTLISGLALTIICLVLSYFFLFNAQTFIIFPTTYGTTITSSENIDVVVEGETDFELALPVTPEDRVYNYGVSVNLFYLYTIIGVVCALVIGIILIYIVTKISLKPLKQLNKEISDTTADDLSKRITGFSTGDELDSLSGSFNEMLERLELAFAREKSFSAGAAHELKTPLAIIKTNTDVLALSEQPTIDEYEQTLDVVKHQTDRMIKLVDSLFAMCSLNGYEIVDTLNVKELINDIVKEHQIFAQEKEIQIKIKCDECTVTANNVMLKHALSNLVSNAIKYNIDGGTIDIELCIKRKNVNIIIADSGIGISQVAAEHIFEPFYREEQSRSRKIAGAGLGLSISKSIIEQHGGSIFYEANIPNGSKFIVSLPIKSNTK